MTTPLSDIHVVAIRRLALATINLSTKSESLSPPLQRYERRYKISKMEWFGSI